MLIDYISKGIMIGIGCVLIYLAIKKEYEPLLLIPIGFGAIMVNIPFSGLMEEGGIFRVIYDLGIAIVTKKCKNITIDIPKKDHSNIPTFHSEPNITTVQKRAIA